MLFSETPRSHSLLTKRAMDNFCHSPSRTLSSPRSFERLSTPSTPTHRFTEAMMEESIENAQAIIMKWDPDHSKSSTDAYLFSENRNEAKNFLKAVKELRKAMHFLISEQSNSSMLSLAQHLMQIAMKRLAKEFYRILSAKRDQLDPESVSGHSSGGSRNFDNEIEVDSQDELKIGGDSINEMEQVSALPISDLKSIADCMINSGYSKECVKIYKLLRSPVVNEGLYNLGVEKYKSSQFHKMNWDRLEHRVKNWLNAVLITVKQLFYGERILCDHVFSASQTMRESCFLEITKEGALNLFRFPELVAKNQNSPRKVFRLLELYEAILTLGPDIESIFSFESTSAIKLQALTSLQKLGDSVRVILSEFESSIQKNSSKTAVVGGGIHPLTESTMDYISALIEYRAVLNEILADHPEPEISPLPELHYESPKSNESSTSALSDRLARLILILLCKLDSKSKLYKDVSLSYLFLTNNLQFIMERVQSTDLQYLLGDEWIIKHTKKLKQYAASYEALAWNKVYLSLPEDCSGISPETAKDIYRKFNAAFEETYQKQTSWTILDGKLRDEIKVSIARKLVPRYQEFYNAYYMPSTEEKDLQMSGRFSPDELGNYLSDLFYGLTASGSSSSSHSHGHHSPSISSIIHMFRKNVS